MAINMILPDEITTPVQREKVEKMIRELQDYKMKSEEEIIQHLITINQNISRKIVRESVGSLKLTGKQNVFDMPWMDKLVVKKLPREFMNSIPIIKIEDEEEPKEFPN
ncbi:hypothetical protein PVK06_026720 [Gossypium arboreum]|uniref:Uncharacterized protein n=1 Tax=Gossypium arboreum TaxID=29729 RepID=A0ABR0NZP9_GOSAR|nr:hypothetical protein PVK06_026720 [Gossypium arboreum]